jgi:hypothetical protein
MDRSHIALGKMHCNVRLRVTVLKMYESWQSVLECTQALAGSCACPALEHGAPPQLFKHVTLSTVCHLSVSESFACGYKYAACGTACL